MNILFTLPSSTMSRKMKAWLEENEIPHIEKRMNKTPIERDEIFKIIDLSENGFDDLISPNSQATKLAIKQFGDLNDLSVNELIDLIIARPKMIRAPIVLGEDRVQIGYNEDEITQFLPREKRRKLSKLLLLGGN